MLTKPCQNCTLVRENHGSGIAPIRKKVSGLRLGIGSTCGAPSVFFPQTLWAWQSIETGKTSAFLLPAQFH
jgi:hypothetical protein